MKSVILLLFALFIFNLSQAQESLFERQVPQAVKKAFVEKFPEITTVEWFKNNDTVIEARFVVDRKKSAATFSTEGAFISSSSEMAPKETPGLVSNYIRGEHPDEVVNLAMMTEDAAGTITYYVEIKRPGLNQPVTKLYFDFYGNITKVIKPEEIKQETDAEAGFDNYDDDMLDGEPIKKKELPSKVNTYIDKNYKDYRFDSAIFVNKDGHGNVYQIKMRKLGYKEYIFLHFNLLGDFIEVNSN